MKTKKLIIISMFVCMSMGLYALESIIPPPVPFPGVKPGLANAVTLICIYILGKKEAFFTVLIRIVLSTLLFGQMMSFWFSLSGGILSFVIMALLSLFMDECNIWAISVFGALSHNIGQIFVAFLITGQTAVFYYFPIMIVSAIVTGVFTGICAKLCINRARKIKVSDISRR